jgi:hypothetical protein
MRPYHAYTPEQAFILPPSLLETTDPDDPVHLARLTLTDPPGQPLAARAQDATVKVAGGESPVATESGDGGFAWALWGPIIGGVIVALAVVVAGGFAWWVRRPHGA